MMLFKQFIFLQEEGLWRPLAPFLVWAEWKAQLKAKQLPQLLRNVKIGSTEPW